MVSFLLVNKFIVLTKREGNAILGKSVVRYRLRANVHPVLSRANLANKKFITQLGD